MVRPIDRARRPRRPAADFHGPGLRKGKGRPGLVDTPAASKGTRSGWRSIWPGLDRRERTISLTTSGLVALGLLLAAWAVPWATDVQDAVQMWLSLLCLPGGVLAGIVALPVREWLADRRQRRRAWRQAVATWKGMCGRLFAAGTFNASADEVMMGGARDGVRIQVRISPAGGQRSTQIIATEDPGLDLTSPHLQRWADKISPVPPLGDPGFDARVSVLGDITRTLAVMDDRTRTDLRVLSRRYQATVDLTSGYPVLSLRRYDQRSAGLPTASEEIVALVEGAAIVSKMRVPKGEFAARLSLNVSEDRSQWVRCRSLQLLRNEYSSSASLADGLAAAARDSSQSVRAMASVLDGDAGGLVELGRLMAREGVPEGVRITALDYAVDHFATEAAPVIKSALRASCESLRYRALQAAAESSHEDLVLEACRLVKGKAANHGTAFLRALIKSKPTYLENALLELTSASDEDVSKYAILALGKAGGEAAIAPLVARVSDAVLGPAARQALRQIRARTGIAHDGRLSLAAPEAETGALSLAAEGGELSRSDE